MTAIFHQPETPLPMIYFTYGESVWGELLLVAGEQTLLGLYFADKNHTPRIASHWMQQPEREILQKAQAQLHEFAAGKRRVFDLPLAWEGTGFQRAVWELIGKIPFASTVTYQDLALKLNQPKAARAVGAATGKNPISIIVPCHRVVGQGNKITGYGGGLERKAALLHFEKSCPL